MVTFSDDGVPFDPLAADAPEKEFDDYDTGGMGIALIHQTANDLLYSHENDRNVLTLVFLL